MLTTGTLIDGNMSTGVRMIMIGAARNSSSASTTNVYGRESAMRTIHIVGLEGDIADESAQTIVGTRYQVQQRHIIRVERLNYWRTTEATPPLARRPQYQVYWDGGKCLNMLASFLARAFAFLSGFPLRSALSCSAISVSETGCRRYPPQPCPL